MPLNTDPAAIPDADYWAEYEQWKVDHPEGFHSLPEDAYTEHPTEAHRDHTHQSFLGS